MDTRPVEACRTPSCGLEAAGRLGYCGPCQAVYDAVRVLHDRRREVYVARVAAGYPDLFARMTPTRRHALLEHLAAHAEDARDGSFRLGDGIADFLAEFAEQRPTGGEAA